MPSDVVFLQITLALVINLAIINEQINVRWRLVQKLQGHVHTTKVSDDVFGREKTQGAVKQTTSA